MTWKGILIQTFIMIRKAYMGKAIDQAMVYRWFRCFRVGKWED